jgi:hypothetical protein
MKMNIIIGGFASSAVIFASAFIYSTAPGAQAAENPVEVVYVDRVVEHTVYVKLPADTVLDPEAIFADSSTAERKCLALNIYFESRGESQVGQEFIGWVTLNRVLNTEFPNDICAVVWQDGQFSWTKDGKSDKPAEPAAWATAQTIADQLLLSARKLRRKQIFLPHHIEPVEHITHQRPAFRAFDVLIQERCLDVFVHIEFVDEVVLLKHKANKLAVKLGALLLFHLVDGFAQKLKFALVETVEHAQNVQQGRFSGTRRPHDGNKFALFHFEVHIVEQENPAAVYLYPFTEVSDLK